MLPNRLKEPMTSNGFAHFMRDAIWAAGLLDDETTHGLRYTAATILNEPSLDWETIASVTDP